MRIAVAAVLPVLLGHPTELAGATPVEYLTQPGQNQDINLKPAQIVILVDADGAGSAANVAAGVWQSKKPMNRQPSVSFTEALRHRGQI